MVRACPIKSRGNAADATHADGSENPTLKLAVAAVFDQTLTPSSRRAILAVARTEKSPRFEYAAPPLMLA
jgi:hypothetical protein